ncbi:hypothetical protein GH714_007407 [Hevea brasiliensis]|uniref:Uncharacterized protein n=1 Tax=Hevea brasiliensis TaxID=3981 RepID=A0A6A6M165_HEVBR|nr:hypothetical protein GH714_007407 [Hevea brasiliensis]
MKRNTSPLVRLSVTSLLESLMVSRPFALAAGLSGANVTSSIILIAGIAEVCCRCHLHGLGGFELGLEKPDPMRALQSALTIAISYIIGGLIPLSP